jgi:outer membrane receptor for ferrienterochelin and colicins
LDIYAGVKNLLNFVPKDPFLRPFDPFDKYVSENNPNGYTFDTSYNYAPIQGAKVLVGLRWTIQ